MRHVNVYKHCFWFASKPTPALLLLLLLQGGGSHRSCSRSHHITGSCTHTSQDGHCSKADERNT